MILMGDAHMRPEDQQRGATAVRASLEQVLDVAAGRPRPVSLPHSPAAPAEPDAFDVCKNNQLIVRPDGQRVTPQAIELVYEILRATPVPGLGPGLGAMPRFRTEVGPFVGMAGSIDGRRIDGGFTETQSGSGWIGGVDLSLRAGVGLDGVIGESGDGLVFVSLGLRADSPSTNAFDASALAQQGGSITAAIPARTGLSTRIRMPFFLIPGDLLLAAPLYFFSPDSYTAMVVTASNGGLIPWQSGWATPYGRFQFVLGRELGVNFYGLQGNDRILAPPAEPGGQVRLVKYKSTYYDLPILEYRPYRAFASNQSSTILVQLFAGLDVPQGESVVSPAGAPPVDVSRNVWSVGLRLVFDWRYYP